ncbi:signal peptidase I [SAR202 cluster bacterium AD-804-J14_MRT_500m]|nr:signal peptidase I [SAR202 cluster bacterium AD-804-J14_MRT_500m]
MILCFIHCISRACLTNQQLSVLGLVSIVNLFKLVKDLTEAVIFALIIFFVLQISVQNFKVEGSSMAPALHSGKYVTIHKLGYVKIELDKLRRFIPLWSAEKNTLALPFQQDGPVRGTVVIFEFPQNSDRSFVKRIIGLPGEMVSIKNGVTYINDHKLDEPYVGTLKENENAQYSILDENQYFVMGDNRPYSNDSRHWGPVPLEKIIGEIWFNYGLPFDLGFMNEAK